MSHTNYRSGNTLVIVLIAVLIILLLAAGGAFYYFVIMPKNASSQAVTPGAPSNYINQNPTQVVPTTTNNSAAKEPVNAPSDDSLAKNLNSLQVQDNSENFATSDTTGL